MHNILPSIILFAPLLAGVFVWLFKNNLNIKISSFISISSIFLSLVCSILVYQMLDNGQSFKDYTKYNWIDLRELKIYWSIYIDKLVSIMFLIVSSVSFCVYYYSYYYMRDDKNINIYYAYLLFFSFFMLSLVCSDNFLQMFFGWEGVGLCSYLLIGFWYTKNNSANAANKAFIVNRIADYSFIMAITIILCYCKSTDFLSVKYSIQYLLSIKFLIFKLFEINLLEIICILLFIGCAGKSAQLGLHIWLPDAMQGPTPVSALIHAATMVTAGVFLIIRCSFLFDNAPITQNIIMIISSITILLMSLIACTVKDIKKIIAFSTTSQLGYMFIACSIMKHQLALFHLFTHAFFKSLLFLAAGNIIYRTHIQNIDSIGGLRNKMKFSFIIFLIGILALSGIYPFAGYYSKDLIIELLYESNNYFKNLAFIMCNLGVFFTAIYSFKMLIKIFLGKTAINDNIFNKIKEVNLGMSIPLVILSMLSIISGYIGIKYMNFNLLNLDIESNKININHANYHHYNLLIGYIPIFASFFGVFISILIYKFNIEIISKLVPRLIKLSFKNMLYFDEIYNFIFKSSLNFFSRILYPFFEKNIIENFSSNLLRKIVSIGGMIISKSQQGSIYIYTLYPAIFISIIFSLILTFKY